jgi:protein-tyrosine phosphatase
MAEAIFDRMVHEAELEGHITVDSCGTGPWHVGEQPCRGTLQVLDKHGIEFSHKARQIARSDLAEADYLVAMDESNLYGIHRLGQTEAEVKLLLSYAPDVHERDVPDPYYVGGFNRVYDLIEAGCQGLFRQVKARLNHYE